MKLRNRGRAVAVGVAVGLVGLLALPALAAAHTTTNTPTEQKGASKKSKNKNKAKKRKGRQKVSIQFAGVAGKTPVSCGKPISGLGTTSRTAQLTDLRFYVSNVQLLRKGGGKVAVKLGSDSPWRVTRGKAAVTLIDLENGRGGCADGTKAMNAYVRGTVPRGQYVGARWRVGVPYALNHTDVTTAAAPLNSTAMAWSWQAGRKFSKIEISDPGGGTPWATKAFMVHVGSTGCMGDPAAGQTVGCDSPNRAEIPLKRFNPAKQKVAVDLKALFAGVDVAGNAGGAPGCMSAPTDPECPAIFKAFGMKLGSKGKARQTVFRAMGR